MCEPLRGKISEGKMGNDCFYYNDVKSAVEFYKKYRGNPGKLHRQKNKIFYIFWEWYGKYTKVKVNDFIMHVEDHCWRYNTWLFDYCFGDVIQ